MKPAYPRIKGSDDMNPLTMQHLIALCCLLPAGLHAVSAEAELSRKYGIPIAASAARPVMAAVEK
jgi:hypothetical protein